MRLGQLIVMGALLLSTLHGAKVHGPTEEALSPIGPTIRVLIAKSVSSALIEAKGGYRVIRPETGFTLSSGSVGKRYVVHAIDQGLRWGEEFPGVSTCKVIPTNRQTVFYVNGYQYKGALGLYLDQNRLVTIVNEVPIEDYLRSVLALKFEKPMSKEALSAMVIGARTEAYAKAISGRAGQVPWDVVSSKVGYFGNGVALQKNGVEEGVEHTRFMVMESKGGEPLKEVRLIPSKIEELAKAGQDAKRILQSCFPHSHLNVTTDPAIR
ncbi:MAG: hypothetical protein S4CHLAM45_14080 [Chlamydiales bacterium]|nr:hypothetical protein [Chlamydiales bacterium]MCH9620513.1 hypothetical protein [Chlamydiales bacterium]MCH9623498.1 hypothetical protein [Chlamydiales bacterium]